jgi:hypothetical protein
MIFKLPQLMNQKDISTRVIAYAFARQFQSLVPAVRSKDEGQLRNTILKS